MQVRYKNKRLEQITTGFNILIALAVAASFAMLFGFEPPLLNRYILYTLQLVLLGALFGEKLVRALNAYSFREFIRNNWFEIPLLAILGIALLAARKTDWFGRLTFETALHAAVGFYLVLEVIIKLCRTVIAMAASGRNPTKILIASFLVLIIVGAGALSLPRSGAGDSGVSFIDALFTSTSATCVTGLVVLDTGTDFTVMGQLVILSLIQLGGLGIVVFGAVFALLLGQALSIREAVALQDLLSARALGRLTNMIAFIFMGTLIIEALGALIIFGMWDAVPARIDGIQQRWFFSVFHSISAFCNAGFSLFGDSFIGYRRCWEVYGVICPLIILGGLGFGVLYDLTNVSVNRVKVFFSARLQKRYRLSVEVPPRLRMQLQTRIVLASSAVLVLTGWAGIYLLERFASPQPAAAGNIAGAFFTSVTARTAGFNTVDVGSMSQAGRLLVMVLMFIGGSPGSAAGGIKTVTLAVLVMTAVAALRKRSEVEIFSRSIHIMVVGRALTVTLLFVAVLFAGTFALCVTESRSGWTLSEIMFEAASALGTVGLSTGITGSLTTAGKLIIIVTMLIGRLGPLTLLAVVTFNLKPGRYNYPQEAVVVG